MIIRTGVSYFGNRTLRHVQRDLSDIASAGFDYLVHCFTENDMFYNLENMRQIVQRSRDAGLEVHTDPWGVAGVFGGEAFSKFATIETGACQVLADGSRIGAICLNQPVLLEFLHQWIDAAVDIGADVVFFDEPHWYPGDLWYLGESRGDQARRWSCRCGLCLELFRHHFGHDMPVDIDDEVRAFRQDAVFRFSANLIGYAKSKGAATALCLLPKGISFELVGVSDWEPFWKIDGLDAFGTDPYWRAGDDVPMEPYVRPNAQAVRDLCDRNELRDQFWLQAYNFPRGTEHEISDAIDIAVEEGMTDIALWSYRGCEALSALWPEDIDRVWDVVTSKVAELKSEE